MSKCPHCGHDVIDGSLLSMHMKPGERKVLLKLLHAEGEYVQMEQFGVPNMATLKVLISRLRGHLLEDHQPWTVESGGWGNTSYRLRRLPQRRF